MEAFTNLGVGRSLAGTLSNFQITIPTPIQEKTIPLIYKGEDVIGQAATGSGKTLAFSSAIIEKVQKKKGVQSLILTPTRELAEQVTKEIEKYSKQYQIRVASVYGGVSINPQIKNLERTEIVVGTPGRILDHLERRTLNLKDMKFLVLDEADRMVDMGFLEDVEKIVSLCPERKQMLLFSATITPDIAYIARKYMHNPKTITVESYVDPSKLRQVFYDVPVYEKFSLLAHLLKNEKAKLIMIFCNTRQNAEMLSKNLHRFNIHGIAIHGGLSQKKRNEVMKEFHEGKSQILICTDVAARGLHIVGVSHVYNYDIPKSSREYIHRIGRTARVGKEGEAVSLVSNSDYQNFRKVMEDSSLKLEKRPLPEFEKLSPMFRQGFGEGRRRYDGRSDGRGRFGRGPRDFNRGRSRFNEHSKPKRENFRQRHGRDSPQKSERFDRQRNFAPRDSRPKRFDGQRNFARHDSRPKRSNRQRSFRGR